MNKFSPAETKPAEVSEQGMSSEDLEQLFNYPSIGELFSENDNTRFDNFMADLELTKSNLERVVRHGTQDEAASANRVIKAIGVTKEFLQKLQKMRLEKK